LVLAPVIQLPGPNACCLRQPIVSIHCGKGQLPGMPWSRLYDYLYKMQMVLDK